MDTKKTKMSRKELTLDQKVELIKVHDKSKKSLRHLADQFNIGKTSVQNILKRKAEVLDAYEENVSGDRKRAKVYVTPNEELNIKTWEWFQKIRGQNLPVSGPTIQEQALIFSKDLGLDSFKASNGWLESFKKRHNISCKTLIGESANVSEPS